MGNKDAQFITGREEAECAVDDSGLRDDLLSSLMADGPFMTGREEAEWGADVADLGEDLLLSWM